MALINNIPIFVESEDLTLDMETTSHPVEKGVEITDHVQRKPVELSLSGKIVDVGSQKAADILNKVKQLKNNGSLITYSGRNALSNLQIQSFSTSHPYTNWGGCDFSMTLKEVRIAKPAYTAVKKNSGGTKQVAKGKNTAVYHKVKKGECVWNLVTKNYKTLKRDNCKTTMQHCKWVMNKNPKAFSRKGDFRTLQIGKKLLVGYRK